MHWWKVGETNVEELLMKQTISEFDHEMKMISKVGIRRNFFFWKEEPKGTTNIP